jgi:hypothetical protein
MIQQNIEHSVVIIKRWIKQAGAELCQAQIELWLADHLVRWLASLHIFEIMLEYMHDMSSEVMF